MKPITKLYLNLWQEELKDLKDDFKKALTVRYEMLYRSKEYKDATQEEKGFQEWMVQEFVWMFHFQRKMEWLEKVIRHFQFYYGDVKKTKGRITPQMVDRAKQYPIEELLEINRAGFAHCIAHDDKRPSMYCKNNFAYCFPCQKSWDTIQILVERDKMSFSDAVKKLAGNA